MIICLNKVAKNVVSCVQNGRGKCCSYGVCNKFGDKWTAGLNHVVFCNLDFSLVKSADSQCVKSVPIQSFSWSLFYRIRTEYGVIRSILPYFFFLTRHFIHPVGCFPSWRRSHKFTRIFSQSQTSNRKTKKRGKCSYIQTETILDITSLATVKCRKIGTR